MRKIGRAGKIRARWKKLSVKKKVLATMATVILLAAAVWGIFRNQSAETGGQNERIVQEATAKTGTVSNTIVGTGNLESDDSISIKIPSGIIIDQVNVESGDQVEKGDVLAVADEASVTGAIESVQEEIEELDEKISKTQS
ncbi:MAG: biotin/lipoyl-binding protein, partial [Blautia sp.]